MNHQYQLAGLLALVLWGSAVAGDEPLKWVEPPGMPGVQTAWITGAATQPGLYILRVKLGPGVQLPPHRHPDTRHVTVLSGSLSSAVGTVWNDASLKPHGPGDFYRVDAGTPHYLKAGSEGVQYQEVGIGPTAQLPPKD